MKVEFHSHTNASRDSLTTPEQIVAAARASGLARIVVTDHNTTRGALLANKIDPQLVIVGEEVLTTRGELLAAFVQEQIPRGLEPLEVIRQLREQGAFIYVPHPFDRRRHGWALNDLLEIAPLVDAIEVFNARCQWEGLNQQALAFAKEHDLAATAGSDAHTPREIGRATLTLPDFSTASELRAIIRQGQVQAKLSSPFIHLTSTYARLYKELWGNR